ncbi:MAG TPA: hypothetical protein VGH34_15745 [Vicinamibacterales bacterium]
MSGARALGAALLAVVLATSALTARAVMLDQRDAPARELAREKKAATDALALQDQSRTTNKAAFRP